MRNQITEFSFGYAFTEELIRYMDNDIDFVPYIPNLTEEGEKAYDLELSWGIPFFIQFKLPKYIFTLTDKVWEYKNNKFSTAFYRFGLRTEKEPFQHNKLVDLNNSGQVVSYVSPIFHKLTTFNSLYFNRQVIENSFIVEPKTIGKFTDEQPHRVSYQSETDFHYFSEPHHVQGRFSFENLVGSIKDNLFQRDKQVSTTQYFVNLEETLVTIIEENDKINRRGIIYNRNSQPAERVVFLAHCFFGCETVLAKLK
jgi:hypothetical protein